MKAQSTPQTSRKRQLTSYSRIEELEDELDRIRMESGAV